ncbi:unnamed protein product [Spodoptera littoralis]|uniref:Odorant receptor n=1 Tax=Spodoptera littoralis TaxID=7109 RepID=A0A9P0I7Y6_SPOLI|nr:unnamed protein product [Spodoptera littoralis]CAH1641829.1 unnamed protein product [Spodoptera littoralis]
MEEEPLLINKTIKKIEIWLRTTGTNVKSTPKTRMDTIKSRAIYIINFFWLNMDLGGAVVWFISGIANKKSFTELTYVSPCITLSFLANFKCFFLFLNEDTVDKLLETLRELEMNERSRPRHKDKDAIMVHEHKFLTNLISFLNVFFCGLIVAFAIGPVTLTIFIYVTTNEVDLQLPFLIIYPFDAFQLKFGLGCIFTKFGPQTISSTYSVKHKRAVPTLKYNIENLIPDDETCGRLVNVEEVRAEFVDLIKWHQDLISSVKLLEMIYTRSTLLNFVSSSALICLTGFNVLAGSDFVYVMTFSVKVSDAVYNCRWYLAGTSLGKDLLLVQTRSQTPCKLTAWDFSEVNLKSFMTILSTAWSYFALLQTLYGSPP